MATDTLMTAAQFESLADQLGPCELVRGEVIQLSPGGPLHSRLMLKLSTLLGEWERETGLGRAYAGDMGLVVERSPDTVRGADLAYYSHDRLPKDLTQDHFWATPPNLVVEILGKGQSWREVLEKVGEYLGMGVDRIWIVDPARRRVHVFRADGEPVVLGESDRLSDDAILPGLSCDLRELFTS